MGRRVGCCLLCGDGHCIWGDCLPGVGGDSCLRGGGGCWGGEGMKAVQCTPAIVGSCITPAVGIDDVFLAWLKACLEAALPLTVVRDAPFKLLLALLLVPLDPLLLRSLPVVLRLLLLVTLLMPLWLLLVVSWLVVSWVG